MARKRNAPSRKAEGVECLLAGDTDVYTTTRARVQYLTRYGLPSSLAAAIAPMAFGETAG